MSTQTDNRWAIGLIVAFVIFGAGLTVMVVASVTRNIDLVTDDYYEKGLKHEQRIQTLRRTQALEEQVSVVPAEGAIALSFPDQFSPALVKGEVLLYRPSDRRMVLRQMCFLQNTYFILMMFVLAPKSCLLLVQYRPIF